MDYGDLYLEPWAEFREVGEDSSLGFKMWILLKKEAGALYGQVKRDLSHIAMKAANEHGWEVIRFSHIQVHQPDKSGSKRGKPAKIAEIIES